jgi:hypothetical protein
MALIRSLDDVEVRGENPEDVRRPLARPTVVPWSKFSRYGPPC